MSPCLSPHRRQPFLPAREGFLCWHRQRSAVLHRPEFLAVADSAGRDDRQPPRVQESLQLPIAERIMCGVFATVLTRAPSVRLAGLWSGG